MKDRKYFYSSRDGEMVMFHRIGRRRWLDVYREDGGFAQMSYRQFQHFEAKLRYRCPSCASGILNIVDFSDLTDPQLLCSNCKQAHIVRGDQLTLASVISRPGPKLSQRELFFA